MRTDLQGNTSIELACGMAEEVVRRFGEVRLRAFGTSMVPAILPRDLVSIQRARLQDISPGEVVVFLQSGRFIVHRVVDRKMVASADRPEEWCLITRGDRLRHADPPVCSPALLGRVVSIERDNRTVEIPPIGANHYIVRLLQSSNRATSLYLRLASFWRTFLLRRAKCQV